MKIKEEEIFGECLLRLDESGILEFHNPEVKIIEVGESLVGGEVGGGEYGSNGKTFH